MKNYEGQGHGLGGNSLEKTPQNNAEMVISKIRDHLNTALLYKEQGRLGAADAEHTTALAVYDEQLKNGALPEEAARALHTELKIVYGLIDQKKAA